MTKALEAHRQAIAAGAVTKTTVIGLRRMLNKVERRNNPYVTDRSPLIPSADQTYELLDLLQERKPLVTGELHTSGLKQLQNKRYRRQLAAVADIVADIDHFRLVDFDQIGTLGQYSTPVYQACTADGRSFRFRNIPWQSGGNGPEIV